MELEGVGGVPMCDLGVEVGGKVDDGNGFEGASWMQICTNAGERNGVEYVLFNANTTTDAKEL